MKKFLLVPLLALSLGLPLAGKEEPVQTEEKAQTERIAPPPPQKMIDEVLADYRAGNYGAFLQKSDEEFQESERTRENNGLLEQRKKLSTMVHDYTVDKTDDFKQKIAALYESQDRELLEIALNHPNEKISREIRDMVFFSPGKEEKESLEFIHGLSLRFKGDGTTPVENKLIAIDTEFWLKGLSLEVAKTQNKMTDEVFQKRYLVLQLEKIKQMKKACQGNLVDAKIKSYVETASTTLPKAYASAATRKHLSALGKGKITPKDSVERKLQSVMIEYLQKEDVLTEKFFPSKDSK